MALASLALGVLSLPGFFCCGAFSLGLSLIGLVLAIISFRKPPGEQRPNRILSIVALVINALVLLASVGGVVWLFIGRGSFHI